MTTLHSWELQVNLGHCVFTKFFLPDAKQSNTSACAMPIFFKWIITYTHYSSPNLHPIFFLHGNTYSSSPHHQLPLLLTAYPLFLLVSKQSPPLAETMNFEVQAETHGYSWDQISLWHKNKLQWYSHLEAAAYLDMRISNIIVLSNASSFKPCSVPKDLWEWVNKTLFICSSNRWKWFGGCDGGLSWGNTYNIDKAEEEWSARAGTSVTWWRRG